MRLVTCCKSRLKSIEQTRPAVSSLPLCREEILLTSEPLIDGSSEVLDVVMRSSCLLTGSSSMVGTWPLTWREGETLLISWIYQDLINIIMAVCFDH